MTVTTVTEVSTTGGSTSLRQCRGKVDVVLGDVTHHNINQLKKVNSIVFPVSYNEKFYKDVVAAGKLAKLAYFNDIVVGGVCCRVDTEGDKRSMYIMTLGCLAPYRRYGLGTMMLQHVFDMCMAAGNIDNIYLHVQINNDSAIEFYSRFGFTIVDTIADYYKRIEPADGHVLKKTLTPGCTLRGEVEK